MGAKKQRADQNQHQLQAKLLKHTNLLQFLRSPDFGQNDQCERLFGKSKSRIQLVLHEAPARFFVIALRSQRAYEPSPKFAYSDFVALPDKSIYSLPNSLSRVFSIPIQKSRRLGLTGKEKLLHSDFVDAKRMPRGSAFGLDRKLSDKIEAKSKGSGLIRLRDEAADAIARLENLENHPNS